MRDDRLALIMALTPGQYGDAPWRRHLLELLGPQFGQLQLVAHRADEDQPTQRCAPALSWSLVAPPHLNRLKRFRGIAACYHRLDVAYLHMFYLACIYTMTKQSCHGPVRLAICGSAAPAAAAAMGRSTLLVAFS